MLNFDKPVKNMTLHNKFVGDFKSVPHYVRNYFLYNVSYLFFAIFMVGSIFGTWFHVV